MKKLILFLFLAMCSLFGFAQTYKYESVPNDPLNARIYKLSNGLTVYLSVYKNAPRIQTYIAVKAGSKNDPSDATGLAHYLEHMVFKGTDKYGTKDYAEEKKYLDQIESLYDVYRATSEETKRTLIYRQIDSLSGIAAKYAIANEYDKVMASLGAKGSNAYTSFEQTVYTADIPSNQLEKWLSLESERFRFPVMRIFHTELEAVYEEKNQTLDDDNDKIWESLFSGLFPTHPYGTQTTIGTVEHLKNPSITKIKEYYNKYYVPGNMAICISGDIDPDQTIKLIEETFGKLPGKSAPEFVSPVEKPILKPVENVVIGPSAESYVMGFRLPGAGTKEADLLTILDKVLYNGNAGLMDLNLNQKQKVLEANSYAMVNKDYSVHILSAAPKEGQKVEELRSLLMEQLELVKAGKFPDWLMKAIVNDMKLQMIKAFESNSKRAGAFVDAFTTDVKWSDFITQIDRLSSITKIDVINFAKANYSNNYVAVHKQTGEDKSPVKVIKPPITPVEINRDDQSPYLKNLLEKPAKEIEPVFISYNTDIENFSIKNNIPVFYKKNNENQLFNLFYVWDMGSNHDKRLPVALEYLNFIGTSKLTPSQVQEEFYKLGCTYNITTSEDQIVLTLSGLNENLNSAILLFEQLLNDPKAEKESLAQLVEMILKKRSDAKLNKSVILWQAMYNYGIFGAQSPFTNILSETELNALKPKEISDLLRGLKNVQHRFLYYGPETPVDLTTTLNGAHIVSEAMKPAPQPVSFTEQTAETNNVYVIDFNMKQAEILMLSKDEPLNLGYFPTISMFSEYFGGGMASVVFQTLRESKALAYDVRAGYQKPSRKDRSHFVMAFIGTQSDKLPEAMEGMFELLNQMPKSENLFNASKESVLQKIRTERITKSDVLLTYEKNKKQGFDYDIRRDIFKEVSGMHLNTIDEFHQKHLKNKKFNILVLGNKSNLDLKTLEKYGPIKFLELKDVFGY